MSRSPRFLLLLTALLALAGCATRPPATDAAAEQDYNQTNDPFEPVNRVFYGINDAIDSVILKPAAEAYVYVVPPAARTGVHNVLHNLNSPVILANDMLQGKPRRAGDTLARFAINSTAGIGGVFDVAQRLGYPYHSNEFGITLALWGVPEGPFLYLPLLGPSDLRDATGYGIDTVADPLNYIGKGEAVTVARYARYGLYAVDRRSNVLGTLTSIKKGALDPYATFRSLYRQEMNSEIEATRNDKRATNPWPAANGGNPAAR